jgi:surface antigen
MKSFAAPLLITAILAAPLTAAAQGGDLLFLRNSPATRFNADDFRMLRATLDKALAGPAEGPALEWKNDKTGAGGTVTPAGGDDAAASGACRRLRIANRFRHRRDQGVYTFCKGNTGKWALRP